MAIDPQVDSEKGLEEDPVDKVKNFLINRNSKYLPQTLEESTATAQQAADALGVTPHQIGKSIAFKASENSGEISTLVVVLCGDNRVDTAGLANELGYAKVKSLDAETVFEKTGFRAGGVCPFALPDQVKIIIQKDLAELDICYLAAGHQRAVVRMHGADIERITGGVVVRF